MAEQNGSRLDLSPAEIDAILLAVRTAELVAKVSNKFKYTLGSPAMQAAQRAGSEIGKGIREFSLPRKAHHFREADEAFGDLRFAVEVLLCAGEVTAREKAVFDEQFRRTRPQVLSLLSSTERRMSERKRTDGGQDDSRQNSGGNAPGATS